MIIKIAVLIMSGSISIFASLLDSILDLISGSIIFVAHWLQKIKTKDYYKYPVGKRRLETLAVIVFAAAMFTATGELLIRSVERIIDPGAISLSFDYISIALVALIIVIKFVLWLICRRADTPSVQAIAQDHINDVFTNAVGIFCAVLGYYFWPLLDPVGGLLLGLFIMVNWAGTGIENVKLMSGRSADPEFLSVVTQLAVDHDPKVKAVDTVRAYFVSNRMVVEIDIILDEDTPLKVAHDIGESLQNKIEKLPDIERAFVHLDFEDEHRHLDEHPTLEKLHARFKTQEQIQLEESQNK
uniref:Uncharacterized protein n=1 Tax=Arcella intermedia TaxID=1963864 RepID=A0A6B2LA69_9EUKA